MTRNELNNEYFDWMYQLVCNEGKPYYRKLLQYLHSVDFEYINPMDGNRAEDGVDLRYRFGYQYSYEGPMIATYLDDRPCSILEMMVALAIRCEEHIMDDPDIGNRTGRWFWIMITNLGLDYMDDDSFVLAEADEVIERFLNREYGRHGEGGLFTIEHCRRDLRTVEIWYQMCWYLDDIL